MIARDFVLRTLTSCLIGGFALFVIVRLGAEFEALSGLDLQRFGSAFGIACVLSLANYLLRFLRWQMFLARQGPRPAALASGLAYMAGFAFTLSPGKAGELMRVRYYSRLGVGAGSVGAGFLMERLLDMAAVCLLCLLGISALAGVAGLLPLVAGGAALVAVIALVLPGLLRALEQRMARVPEAGTHLPDARQRVWNMARAAYHQVRSLMHARILWPGLLIGLVAWALEGIGFWLLVVAGGLENYGAGHAVAVYSVSLLAGAASFMPGGLGGTEAVMLLVLDHAGAPAHAALVITLLCRLATLWLAVVLGWVAVAILAFQRNGNADAS